MREQGRGEGAREGNLISVNHFGTHIVDEKEDLKIYYLCTILNFQRQFSACEGHETNSTFGDELLGNRPKADKDEVSNAPDKPIIIEQAETRNDLHEHLHASLADINIPALNESQQKACDAFLSDHGANIHIVQGYVRKVRPRTALD